MTRLNPHSFRQSDGPYDHLSRPTNLSLPNRPVVFGVSKAMFAPRGLWLYSGRFVGGATADSGKYRSG